MSVLPGAFLLLRRLFDSSLVRVVEAPGAWFSTFLDNAEDIWATDPLLSDEDDFSVMNPLY
jgi:hypothetical protein